MVLCFITMQQNVLNVLEEIRNRIVLIKIAFSSVRNLLVIKRNCCEIIGQICEVFYKEHWIALDV